MDDRNAKQIEALLAHPSWTALTDEVAAFRQRYYELVTKALMVDGKPPDDWEYKRGFLEGMKYLCKFPSIAEKKVEQAMAREREKV